MATVSFGELSLNLMGSQASNLILKPIFFDDVKELFDIMPMVSSEKKMAYSGTMQNVLQKAISCGMLPKGDLSIYERCINTNPVGAYVTQCYDEVLNLTYQELLKNGEQISDLSGTVIMEVLVRRVQEAIKKDCEKLAFYGDKASANADINLVDGMWVYIFDLVAKGLIPYVNSGSGAPLGAGDAIDLLTEMWEEAPNVMKALPNNQKVFLVSASVYQQYLKDLEAGSINSEAYTPNIENGGLGATFRGIQVRPMWDWEGYALDYQGQADAHQAIYTTRDNMVMATDVASPETQLRIWFDEDTELNKVRTKFRFGFNYKLSDFIVAAY